MWMQSLAQSRRPASVRQQLSASATSRGVGLPRSVAIADPLRKSRGFNIGESSGTALTMNWNFIRHRGWDALKTGEIKRTEKLGFRRLSLPPEKALFHDSSSASILMTPNGLVSDISQTWIFREKTEKSY
jgi:hypothetical protein